jgi:hypothetical protein
VTRHVIESPLRLACTANINGTTFGVEVVHHIWSIRAVTVRETNLVGLTICPELARVNEFPAIHPGYIDWPKSSQLEILN